MADETNNFLRVGVITTTHGLRGEVKVFPTTDDTARFKELSQCFAATRHGLKELKVRSVKFFKQFVILGFEGYEDINLVMEFIKCDLLVTRENAVSLNPGEYFICDLIGNRVFSDEGDYLGILKDIMTTAANNVYIVEKESGGEILIPVIEECNPQHDLNEKTTTVHLLKGLLDL